MTDSALQALYGRRNAALARTREDAGFNLPLREMDPIRREAAERTSRAFRTADAAIVAELIRRDRPAVLGPVTLWLTADRLHYVEVWTKSGELVYAGNRDAGTVAASVLYRYPEEVKACR